MSKKDYKNPASRNAYEEYISNLKTLPVSFVYNGTTYRGFNGNIFKQLKKNGFVEIPRLWYNLDDTEWICDALGLW